MALEWVVAEGARLGSDIERICQYCYIDDNGTTVSRSTLEEAQKICVTTYNVDCTGITLEDNGQYYPKWSTDIAYTNMATRWVFKLTLFDYEGYRQPRFVINKHFYNTILAIIDQMTKDVTDQNHRWLKPRQFF